MVIIGTVVLPQRASAFDVCSDAKDYNNNAPCTHEEMTAYGFEVYKEKNSDTKLNIEKLEYGAGHEDEVDHIYAWHKGALPGSVTFTHFWDADATYWYDSSKLNRYAQVELDAPGLDSLSSLCGVLAITSPALAAACFLYVEFASDPRPFANGWQKVEAYWSLALGAYATGNLEGNSGAYHYLGHIAHHIGDNTIPTHVHLSGHDPISGDDSFEDWMSRGGKDDEKKEDPGSDVDDELSDLIKAGPLEIPEIEGTETPIEKLYWLMYTTNQIADFFASDRAGGDMIDLKGWVETELAHLASISGLPRHSSQLEDNDCTGIACIAGGEADFDNNEDGDLGEIKKYSYLRGIRAMASLFDLFDQTVSRQAILNVSIDRVRMIDFSNQFDDCDDVITEPDCDFYSRVTINGYSGQNEADAIDNDDDISPSGWNWGHAFDPFRTELIEIEIEILDEDNTVIYPVGPDGQVNLSVQEGYGLTFQVDPQKCMNGEPGAITSYRGISPLSVDLRCGVELQSNLADDDDEDDDGQAVVHFTITMVSPDLTPPVIICDPADGLWHDDDVNILCTATDDGVGLANPADASFTLSTNVAEGTETDNASTDMREICDDNDNCAVAGPIPGNKVDKKAPVINIVQPGPSQYTHSETLVLDYSVIDGGSGVKTVTPAIDGNLTIEGHGLQSGQAINLLTALPLGPHTFTVEAKDKVDNSSPTASVAFTIIVTPQSIIEAVGQFADSGAIKQKVVRSLLAKLSNALKKWDQEQCLPAVNMYDAFINEVQAQGGKSITLSAADILMADAKYLIAHCSDR